jgi:hypothetical protein
MPELSDSNPPPLPPAASSTVNDWERYEGFRQTFLIHFRTQDQETFQHLAQFLFDAILERPLTDEALPGPWTGWELRAALAEMRFLEGYLRSVWQEKDASSLPRAVEELCSFAAGASAGLAEVALTLEQELNRWQRKHPRGSR